MVRLRISIHARDDKRKELLRTCRFITDRTRQEKGCKSSEFSKDKDRENTITLEQQYDRWPSLNNYFRSDHFTALLGAMKLLGESYEIRINEGSRTEGMEAVQAARLKEDVSE